MVFGADFRHRLGVAVLLFLSTGCATVIKGKSQRVDITSTPSSANVYVNNSPVGSTPLSHRFSHGRQYLVEVRKQGYPSQKRQVTSSFSGHSLWIFPWSTLFDATFGSVTTIDQKKLHFQLGSGRATVDEQLWGDAPRSDGTAWTRGRKSKPPPPKPHKDLKVAVLEFRNLAKLSNFEIESVTDMVRGSALSAYPQRLFVLTRENIRDMLPPDVRISDCEGSCEVETGRNIGADFIVTGSVGRFGSRLQVKMKLHNTKNGRLLSTQVISAKNIELLEAKIKKSGENMFSEAMHSVPKS